MESDRLDKLVRAGIGAGLFLLITTCISAFIVFGRLTELTYVLFIGEIIFTIGLIIIFWRRKNPWKELSIPVAIGILLSVAVVAIVIFIGTTLIHAPLPPPDSPAWSSGSPVIIMAVRTDEISTSSPEARELLISGLRIAARNNQFAAAIPYYDQALALDPNFTEAWMAKGVALHNLGSFAEAVDCIDRALAIDPGNAAARSLKGSFLDSWGRSDEAAGCRAKAIELDPKYQYTPPVTAIPTAPPVIITPNVSYVRSSESHSPDSNRAAVIPLLFKPSPPGTTSLYPQKAQIFSIRGVSGSVASPFSSQFYTLLPWLERSQQPPFEQRLIYSALDLSVHEGINPLDIVEYNISVYSDPPYGDVYDVGLSLGTRNISLENQLGSIAYLFKEEGNGTEMYYMDFSLSPAGEVILETPYTAYHDPSMHITSVNGESRPILIYDVSLGYYVHKRPYNRGEFFEPAWIFYGINRKGEMIAEWVWASRDRGWHPLKDDLQNASVAKIILHASEQDVRSLTREDASFDSIQDESKQILHEITVQCSCFMTPEQIREQRQNSSYVEVIFSQRTNVAFALMENPGPDDMVETQIDGVLIAFDGPYGEMIFPFEYYSETDSILWGMRLSKRNLSFIRNLSAQALAET